MNMHHHLMRRPLGCLALGATLLFTAAATAQQTERFDMNVREHFFAGFHGDSDALQRGMAIVEETLQARPDHPQALVWQASGWYFQSGQAYRQGDFDSGTALFDKSVAQFERAVSLAPGHVGVLIPRAAAFLQSASYVTHAPTRVRLLETVVGDYTRVLELQKPYLTSLATHNRGELFGGLADALWQLDRREEARVFLQHSTHLAPDRDRATESMPSPGSTPTTTIPMCRRMRYALNVFHGPV